MAVPSKNNLGWASTDLGRKGGREQGRGEGVQMRESNDQSERTIGG